MKILTADEIRIYGPVLHYGQEVFDLYFAALKDPERVPLITLGVKNLLKRCAEDLTGQAKGKPKNSYPEAIYQRKEPSSLCPEEETKLRKHVLIECRIDQREYEAFCRHVLYSYSACSQPNPVLPILTSPSSGPVGILQLVA